MRCGICCRPDAKQINLELLQRAGRRTGTVVQMARRLGVARHTSWRHREEHLKIYVSKRPMKTEGLSFEERARLLGSEADRLQAQCENGAPRDVMDQALKSLALRVKLLELESRFAGRPMSQQREEMSLEDPEEASRAEREYMEVVGGEQ
jgi:hypothetical protein